ncbi:MAG: CPBP family intramembrane metalloprotease [Lachnospiraceae bacterium]|nr:CPBP family intramembrane metalloprotease [Lachnospiraceae bacterium]
MNSKKVNWLFLIVIVMHFAVSLLLSYTPVGSYIGDSIAINLILAQMIVWVPTVVFLIATKTNPVKFCRFRCVKPTTLLMTVLFTMLCSPIITLANAVSMLFVENTMVSVSGQLLQLSLGAMFFLVAIHAPFFEEFVCRGVFYQGYKKQGNSFKAMLLSALLFALIHLNFNQAAYAFIAGIMLILMMEATDSIWPSFLIHMCINGFSVVVTYAMSLVEEDMVLALEEAAAATGTEDMLLTMSLYFLLAVICTPLAGCVLVWIAGNEGRQGALKELFDRRKEKKEKLITIPLVIAVVMCLAYMILIAVLGK